MDGGTHHRVDDSRRVAHPKLEGGLFFATDRFAAFFKLCFGSPPRHHQRTLVTFHFQSKSQSLNRFQQMTLVFSSIHFEHPPKCLFVAGAHKTIHFRIALLTALCENWPIPHHHITHSHQCTAAPMRIPTL